MTPIHTITGVLSLILLCLAVYTAAEAAALNSVDFVERYIASFDNTDPAILDFTGPCFPGGDDRHIVDTTQNILSKLRECNPNYDKEDWATFNANSNASVTSNIAVPARDSVPAEIKATGNNINEVYCGNDDGTSGFGDVSCLDAASIINFDLQRSGTFLVAPFSCKKVICKDGIKFTLCAGTQPMNILYTDLIVRFKITWFGCYKGECYKEKCGGQTFYLDDSNVIMNQPPEAC
ncbi:hypothetical protein LTR37_021072 [Vermiconidia calcicola]|uniref:Uncharacterized protein n=1 Tax=Vermiconidia calcicola TaxID=1690605 RepID=A0ACC3M9R7_9PEZI|nr:hypothetical protein LTR37_021072 [Vermiconidia calcicola]